MWRDQLSEYLSQQLPHNSPAEWHHQRPRIVCYLASLFHMNEYVSFDDYCCPVTLYNVSMNTNLYPWGSSWESGLNENFGVSGEWDLIKVTETSFRMGQPYPKFVLYLHRKTTFYTVVMLLPMVLTSYLNVLVFLLPPDLGDKASYLVTLTASMSVYAAFFNTDMTKGAGFHAAYFPPAHLRVR